VGASVGIAFAPQDAQTRDELLRCADVALYAAKAGGRGRAARYAPAMDADNARRAQLLSELHGAAERGEFVLHYQPRVRPHDGAITSAEALIRWNHPQRGLLAPNLFIGIAEDSGLIEPIGRWVLDAACAQMAAWRQRGINLQRVSVNVSQGQLAAGDFPQHVRATLARHGLPATALELEVTESLFASELSLAREQLETLRAWGVTIALDDFGTGYSSMSVLRSLPIDVLKIDRSFVMDLGVDQGATAVVRSIVTLAAALNMELVAEGVETLEQAQLLGEMQSHELQGFFYSRPVPPISFEKLTGLLLAEAPAAA
jgi:EAL domain-containing protein (putative c-di-GMP-specific phosphodiesterase class I)